MSKEGNYTVDYEDERFDQVEKGKDEALGELDKTYGDMIEQSDKYFKDQADAVKGWEEAQKKNQQDQTDFAIEQVEQNKEQAKKDYLKEQSGAYTDWQKQSNEYGANAEKMAANGMTGSGYRESSQVSMYNTYQNRVAAARESYGKAVQNYDNAITQARLQNNSALAEIAFKSLQQELELALNGFQYKNQLILDRTNQKIQMENSYYGRYMDVLNQINQENALAEQIRQFNFANKLGEFAGAGSGGGGYEEPRRYGPGPASDELPRIDKDGGGYDGPIGYIPGIDGVTGRGKDPSLTDLVNAGVLDPKKAVEYANSKKTNAQKQNEKWKWNQANGKLPGGVRK